MTRTASTIAVVLTLLGASSVTAARFTTERSSHTLTLLPGGMVVVENVSGNVRVTGADIDSVVVNIERVFRANDPSGLARAREATLSTAEGHDKLRVIRTVITATSPDFGAVVNYELQVPRYAKVRIGSKSADDITVTNIQGSVAVTNINGRIALGEIAGPVSVESINGSITFDAISKPIAEARLTTINGNIELRVPSKASFTWIAQSMRPNYVTTFKSLVGRAVGPAYQAFVNGSKGPAFRTTAVMGSVALLRDGTKVSEAKRIFEEVRVTELMMVARARQIVRRPLVDGNFQFESSLGEVAVGEVRGSANVKMGAGEVQLGIVRGICDVVSLGGPLRFGDVTGRLNARTSAGDISIQSARGGGTITTGGGTIRLNHTGGPTRLQSGGGDIVVRQASEAVSADTRSGDIAITMDPSARSQRISAKTGKGNVLLNLNPAFGADVEVTIVTSDPTRDLLRSDFPLSIQREQVGGKTRIRAFGKINGGGERVELSAEEGGVQITSSSVPGMPSK